MTHHAFPIKESFDSQRREGENAADWQNRITHRMQIELDLNENISYKCEA